MKISNHLSIAGLKEVAPNFFTDMVKAVVDIELSIIAFDAQLHVDLEQALLEAGSKQKNLWGINLYPELFGTQDFIEFDSMINIRPVQSNNSRFVESEEIRLKIIALVNNLIKS